MDGIFDFVAERLEALSSLEALEARGTLHIALEEAGLHGGRVLPEQIRAVIQRSLPAELEARGVEDATEVCDALAKEVAQQAELWHDAPDDSPEDIFRRLGGRSTG